MPTRPLSAFKKLMEMQIAEGAIDGGGIDGGMNRCSSWSDLIRY